MTLENYKKYAEMLNADFGDLIEGTQEKLNASTSKENDIELLFKFWGITIEVINSDWDCIYNYEELLTDCNSMLPMPASVSKQMSLMLFKIKNLNPLFDMPINEGFY